MLTAKLRYLSCAVLIACSLAACSSGEAPSEAMATENTRQFSAEDKRAAEALSIGNSQEVAAADSPYSRALLCRNGMAVLAANFENAAGLSRQQRKAMEQASAYFDRQLQQLGSEEDKSASEIASDLERTAEENADLAANARTAVACLQRLRDAG